MLLFWRDLSNDLGERGKRGLAIVTYMIVKIGDEVNLYSKMVT